MPRIPVIFVLLSTLVLAACDTQRAAMGPRESNLLGIVKHEEASYASVGPNTFRVSSDEVFTRRNFSGDKTTYLWGLVTLTDY